MNINTDLVGDVSPQSADLSPSTLEKAVQTRNSRMRQQFDRVVCNNLGIPDRYQNVAVLIIRWARNLDNDRHCDKEVDELDSLFRDQFGFKSSVVTLENVEKRPQLTLNRAVSNFVYENDGPHRSNLLIVYYTGHGYSDGTQRLMLAGTAETPQEVKGEGRYAPQVVWSQAERDLKNAEADVLQILDCCFAGCVVKARIEDTKTHEVLAATDELTPRAGPRSYTRALIDSLKEALETNAGRPFCTFELNQNIMRRKNWEGKPQLLKISGDAVTRHIRLTPLPKQDERVVQVPSSHAGWLQLRIGFAEHTSLEDEQVERLAELLSDAAKKSELGINAIDWLGFVTDPFRKAHLMMKYGKKMQQMTKRKRRQGDSGHGLPATKHQAVSPVTPEASGDAMIPAGSGF